MIAATSVPMPRRVAVVGAVELERPMAAGECVGGMARGGLEDSLRESAVGVLRQPVERVNRGAGRGGRRIAVASAELAAATRASAACCRAWSARMVHLL